jgi:hypothetical protein
MNDEIQMSKLEGMKIITHRADQSLVCHSGFLRHSSFVLRHFFRIGL